MAQHDCTTIAISLINEGLSTASIVLNYLDDVGNVIEQFDMGRYTSWDIEGMSLVIRKLVAKQIALWKPPRT